MRKLTFAMVLGFVTTTSFAQAERKCPTEKLSCKLEKQLATGGRTLVAETVSEYSGFNTDEPSVEPASCTIETNMVDANGIVFNVYVDELSQMTNIFLVKNSDYGLTLPGDVAFNVTKGSPFYYRYYNSLLTCTLK